MQLSALLPSSPHPRAYPLEVFKADRPLCAFGTLNQTLADRMIHVFGKTTLLTGELFEPPPRRFRAFLLELRSQPPMPVAHVVDGSAAIDRAVRVAGDVGHAQIDPKHVVSILGVEFFALACHQQIPVSLLKQQVAFALLPGKQDSLACTADERDHLPPAEGPDRNGRVGQGEGENTLI